MGDIWRGDTPGFFQVYEINVTIVRLCLGAVRGHSSVGGTYAGFRSAEKSPGANRYH